MWARLTSGALGLLLLGLAGVAPGLVWAQQGPRVEVVPAMAAPGELVSLRGSGWPGGAGLGTRLYEAGGVGGASASLGGAITVASDGTFSANGTLPPTLFGQGSRGNLTVVPGQYTLVVSQDSTRSASTSLTVGAPARGALVWGEVAFDLNGNGTRDGGDLPAQALVTLVEPAGDSPPQHALTDARGRFALSGIAPGEYRLSSGASHEEQTWTASVGASAADRAVVRVDLLLQAPSPQGTPASLLGLQDSTLYGALGDRLRTADLADPLHPAVLGESPPLGGQVRSLTLNGNLAAVALTGGGIQLISFADPRAPLVVGSYATSNSTAGVAFAGAFLLVPNGGRLDVLDLSNPGQPRRVATYDPPGDIRGVTVAGRYAYVVTLDSWLRIVDVVDPTRPTEVGATHIDGVGFLSEVAVAHGNAFGTFIFGHLTASIVIDVSDPTRPQRRADVDPTLYGDGGFAIQHEVLYAANRGQIGFGSVGTVALDDPRAPRLIGSLTAPWDPLAIAVRGSLAYVLGGDGLVHVVDVANPAQLSAITLASLEPVPLPPPVAHDERYFVETGYRIDDDGVWQYFLSRGGLDVFGYPVSRPFRLLGCGVQMFQRTIAQTCEGQTVQLMNVLDPDLLPYTRINFSTFPESDPALKAATPQVGDPDYASAILEFVAATAPDVWDGQPVNFGSTFFSLVTAEIAGTDDPGLLGLVNLEVWGAPTSQPAADPGNPGFIYQRFQRGIMHFDASTGVTRGILLADYLKGILRGADLPADLRAEASGSRLFTQYCPGAPGWLCRPDDLLGTDLTFAFQPA